MIFSDALKALAAGLKVRRPGQSVLQLLPCSVPINTTHLVTSVGLPVKLNNNWILYRPIVAVEDRFERPCAFTDEEIAANNWELVR